MKALDNIKKLELINQDSSNFGENDIQIDGLNNRINDFIFDFKKRLIPFFLFEIFLTVP